MTRHFPFVLLGALVLSACAGPMKQVALSQPTTVRERAPGGGEWIHLERVLTASDGVALYRQSWLPVREPPKAAVVLVHGLRDHSGRYLPLAEALVQRGYAVFAYDHRGHGRSAGPRVWVDRFEQYLADLDLVLEQAEVQARRKPLFLFGHSMGGAIVTLYSLERGRRLDGLVLSAPALKPGKDVSGFLIGVTRVTAALFPGLGVLNLDPEKFARREAVVEANRADPLVHQGAGPARTAAELLGALEALEARVGEVDTPLLVLHGDADEITDPDGSRGLVQRARTDDKTLRIVRGAWHDLLHEPEAPELISEIVAWLEARTAPPTPRGSVEIEESGDDPPADETFGADGWGAEGESLEDVGDAADEAFDADR